MAGIVIDLQRDALNSNVDTVALLRKAYLIARKLKLSDFGEWVDCELNGYRARISNIPQYRALSGQLRAWNPYNGIWMPVIFQDNEAQNRFSERILWDSIPSLVSVLQGSKGNGKGLHMSVSAETTHLLNGATKPNGFDTNYSLFFSPNQVEAIIETVRNHILDWSVLLEDNGVVGEGLVFSKEEKKQAENPQIVNYINNFYGAVDNTQLQQGTSSSEQSK